MDSDSDVVLSSDGEGEGELQLGNVDGMEEAAMEPVEPADPSPRQQRPWDPQEFPSPLSCVAPGKVLLLFDLNGVLAVKHFRPDLGKPSFTVRPGIEHLLELPRAFQIGVYSSAKRKTIEHGIAALVDYLNLAQRASRPCANPLPRSFFEVVIDRDFCAPDPDPHARPDGNEWDVVKPLARHGLDLTRTVLVDHNSWKAVASERNNMLLLPEFKLPSLRSGQSDSEVDGLLGACVPPPSPAPPPPPRARRAPGARGRGACPCCPQRLHAPPPAGPPAPQPADRASRPRVPPRRRCARRAPAGPVPGDAPGAGQGPGRRRRRPGRARRAAGRQQAAARAVRGAHG
jgi:hypothetical protein